MKNNTPKYPAKSNAYQIKSVKNILYRKSLANSERLCEKSMRELKAIYWHEKQLLIALPILMSSATTFELLESLSVHLKYVKEHVSYLENNFPNISTLPLSEVGAA